MTRLLSKFILLGAVFISLTADANSKEEIIMHTDNKNVLNVINTMTSSFNNKDINGVLSAYENGAGVMFEPGSKTTKLETLKQNFEGAFQLNPKFSYPNGHEVYVSNNIALHIAPWVMKGIAPDGSTIQESGLSVAVLRKQKDGRWLMVLDNPNGQHLLEVLSH